MAAVRALACVMIGASALLHAGPPSGVPGLQPALDVVVAQTVWRIDQLAQIGGHAVEVVGSPRVVDTKIGKAVEFDGVRDGLVVPANPIAGLERFTVEVLFEPAPDGPEEQRFLHIQEANSENRALVELRMLPGAQWCLDTYLLHDKAAMTLIDRNRRHPAGQWHAAALTFDGETMTHYVNRQPQGSGVIAFRPLGPGRTSIGVRQNRVSYFKGRIQVVRFSAAALSSDALLEAP